MSFTNIFAISWICSISTLNGPLGSQYNTGKYIANYALENISQVRFDKKQIDVFLWASHSLFLLTYLPFPIELETNSKIY